MGSLLAHVIYFFSITIFSFFFLLWGNYRNGWTFSWMRLQPLICFYWSIFCVFFILYISFIYFIEKINKRKVNWGKDGDLICFVGIYLQVMSLYRPNKCFVGIYLLFMSLYRPNLFCRYLFTKVNQFTRSEERRVGKEC